MYKKFFSQIEAPNFLNGLAEASSCEQFNERGVEYFNVRLKICFECYESNIKNIFLSDGEDRPLSVFSGKKEKKEIKDIESLGEALNRVVKGEWVLKPSPRHLINQ